MRRHTRRSDTPFLHRRKPLRPECWNATLAFTGHSSDARHKIECVSSASDQPVEGSDPGTLTVLYEETRRTIDQQFELVESLTNRSAQLLGFAAIIVSVVGSLNANQASCWVQALVITDVALFSVAAALCFAAWRFHTYRDDPHPEQLYSHYRHSGELAMRDQIIGNRFAAIRENDGVIARKRAWIRDASWILAAGFVVLVALVVVRLFN